MRKDMAKLLVERPRFLETRDRGPGRLTGEEAPAQISLRRSAQGHGAKGFSENFAPLRRYLDKQVGRAWNKVFSEISAQLDTRCAVQLHVRGHLKDFIKFDIQTKCGSAFGDGLWPQIFYVDDCDGILKRTADLQRLKARARSVASAAPADRIDIGPCRELRRLNGVWFELTFEAPAAGRDRLALPEPRVWADAPWEAYGAARALHTYAVSKRQLSKDDLRRHGLSNAGA